MADASPFAQLCCLVGFHHWVGHPPFGLTPFGALCTRECSRCGKRSHGLGYDEQSMDFLP